ncbi:amidohydrolase family protein [Tardiphaga sp.]|jgi:aminocarboxymuconate-semialdehyde decarboxylase|uniref:amidohydrolase family protein n=1 Tax=Tardiphaga sp. TaxID=1926292 RepID=UPI0037D9B511
MPIIDMHTHALSKRVEPLVAGKYDPMSNPYRRDMSPASRDTDAEQGKILPGLMLDVAKRREMMAKMGVDIQVVAPAPAQQNYWADEELLVALSRVQNEDIAALVAQDPQHFAGMGTLPMRFPQRAIEEAVHGVETLGLRGFQVDTRVEDLELSNAAFDPLYARLAELRAPLFVHPLGFSHGQRLGDFFMVNSVGQPVEETMAIAHFIMGGILDRHPGLDVVIAHGGGYYPFYAARMDHAWKVRPEVRRLIPEAPSTYLKRFWFDTCVFSPTLIEQLIAMVGVDRVMMGSDYPFDMGDDDPVGLVRQAKLSDGDREKILFGNASRLFRIA